jgi:prolyl-tRNA editing enzyme YbaK/EbsC (Cys-tRNA(Pro) deacylase)
MEKSSEKFKRILNELNLQLEIITFEDSTKTSQQAADQLKTQLAQIGKSIVFKTQSEKFVIVITSGVNRVNEQKIEAELNEKLVKTNGEEIRKYIGFPIGGIPPFGHDNKTIMFIDENLLNFNEIFCAGGTPNSIFAINPEKLIEITNAKPLNVL